MRALVIDDSRAMRLILARIARQLGFDVVEAGNGQEALDRLEELDTVPELGRCVRRLLRTRIVARATSPYLQGWVWATSVDQRQAILSRRPPDGTRV